jgi:precorrin-6B methylase 2
MSPDLIHRSMQIFRERLSEGGPVLRTYRAGRHLSDWLRHERRQTVDTSLHMSLESLGVDHPDAMRYEPTGWSVLRTLLPRSDVRPTDVFVDFGSGMGRMVQQAARYPFARVIGVELSERLNEIARSNFERNKGRVKCQSVEFVTCDAGEFSVPDDMTHAYLFNPFVGETFRKVVQNIIASVDRAPRRVLLVYETPTLREALEQTGRFRLLGERKTALRRRTLIYEVTSTG